MSFFFTTRDAYDYLMATQPATWTVVSEPELEDAVPPDDVETPEPTDEVEVPVDEDVPVVNTDYAPSVPDDDERNLGGQG